MSFVVWIDVAQTKTAFEFAKCKGDLETVSRTFNTLKREGFIDFTRRGHATVLRIDKLTALTGD